MKHPVFVTGWRLRRVRFGPSGALLATDNGQEGPVSIVSGEGKLFCNRMLLIKGEMVRDLLDSGAASGPGCDRGGSSQEEAVCATGGRVEKRARMMRRAGFSTKRKAASEKRTTKA